MHEKDDQTARWDLLIVFGTRPEAIKLAPVVEALRGRPEISVRLLCTGQQADLLPDFLERFALLPDARLQVMQPGQSLNRLLARLLEGIDAELAAQVPDLVMVQGDTTSCLAGALAARQRGVPVVHVEAGLRTSDAASPFPEEFNRRLVSRLASLHCAATPGNRATLLTEGHDAETVIVTGNPVVDAIAGLAGESVQPSGHDVNRAERPARRRIVMTAHRRENVGRYLDTSLAIMRDFVISRPDIELVFLLHPNPSIGDAVRRTLVDHPRIELRRPLGYEDFIRLCATSWLLVSDSGGLQEEAASLGRPLLVLRALTERPEALDSGIARIVGPDPTALRAELEQAAAPGSWVERVGRVPNPFGDGSAGQRIADAVSRFLESAGR